MSWDDLDALNFTELAKKSLQAVLVVVDREALNEEVALLLGVLESLLLSENLSLALVLRDSRLDIEDVTLEFLAVELLNSVEGALRSVALVIIMVVADKGEGFLFAVLASLGHDDAALDISKG